MFFKHPLFWKEWKTAKWWSLLMGSMFVVMFLSIGNSLNKFQEMLVDQSGSLAYDPFTARQAGAVIEPIFLRELTYKFGTLALLLLPVIVIMSIIFFQSDRKESVGMFVSSLPFTKGQQFRVKYFTGVLAFSLPFIVASLFAVLMRQVNIGWISQWYSGMGYSDMLAYDSVWMLLSIFVQSYVFMLAFFSVLMLMQSLMANNIAASIIGTIVLAAPWFILEAGGATVSRMFNDYSLRLYNIEWASLYYFMGPNRDISMDYYIIILLVIAGLALYGGRSFYEKNDNSRNGYLLMFPWFGKILVPGVTVCSALLGNNMINTFFRIESLSLEIISLVISGLIGYLVIARIISLTEKHGI